MQSSLKFDEGYCNFSGTRYPIKYGIFGLPFLEDKHESAFL